MKTKCKTNAVAYLRTSSATNADGDSQVRQRAAIAAFSKTAGFELVDEFADLAVSGAAVTAPGHLVARLQGLCHVAALLIWFTATAHGQRPRSLRFTKGKGAKQNGPRMAGRFQRECMLRQAASMADISSGSRST